MSPSSFLPLCLCKLISDLFLNKLSQSGQSLSVNFRSYSQLFTLLQLCYITHVSLSQHVIIQQLHVDDCFCFNQCLQRAFKRIYKLRAPLLGHYITIWKLSSSVLSFIETVWWSEYLQRSTGSLPSCERRRHHLGRSPPLLLRSLSAAVDTEVRGQSKVSWGAELITAKPEVLVLIHFPPGFQI